MLGCRQIFQVLKGAVNLKRLKNTALEENGATYIGCMLKSRLHQKTRWKRKNENNIETAKLGKSHQKLCKETYTGHVRTVKANLNLWPKFCP